MAHICRSMATVIRHVMPERPDGWAASIHAEQYGSPTMGIYFIGWAGRPDKWHLHEGQDRKATDAADWLTLRERLRVALTELGIEGDQVGESGDFFLSDVEIRPRMIIVYVKRPEFLTKELITVIQNALRDGYADWVVDVSSAFPAPFDELLRGIEVRTNGIAEMWDRQEAERMLGDRLKI